MSQLTGITRRLADGTLDESFGDAGVVVSPTFSTWPTVGGRAVSIQSDGKIVVASGAFYNEIRVSRYFENGQLDPSFGDAGSASFRWWSTISVNEMLLFADGSILLVGDVTTLKASGHYRDSIFLSRFDAAGQRDESFGQGGIVITAVSDFSDSASDVAVLPDGKIVVAGSSMTPNGERSLFVARYSHAGIPDDQFGDDIVPGVVRVADFGQGTLFPESNDVGLVVQPSGRLVLAATRQTSFTTADFTLIGIASHGALDASFGPPSAAGILVIPIPGVDDAGARDLALAPDGRILVVGESSFSQQGIIVRLSATGTLDLSWDHDGIFASPTIREIQRIFVHDDGAPLVAFNMRTSPFASVYDFGLAQFSVQGSLDASFGDLGVATYNFLDANSAANSSQAVIQADGKLIQTGVCELESGDHWCLVRRDTTGALDTSFGSGGRTSIEIGFGDGAPLTLLHPDGSLMLIGNSRSGGVSRFRLTRITRDGALDVSWSNGGSSFIGVGAFNLHAVAAELQPDGAIIIQAMVDFGSGFETRLYRVLASGMRDLNFGDNGSVEFNGGATPSSPGALLVQADGTIVAVTNRSEGNVNLVEIHRRLANGKRNVAWEAFDPVLAPVSAIDESANCGTAAFTPTGQILVGCQMAGNMVFLRFRSDGLLDSSFGNGGRIDLPAVGSFGADLSELIMLPSGDFAVIGWDLSTLGDSRYVGLVQFFHPNGMRNESLGESGVLRLERDDGSILSVGGRVTPDGQLVVIGRTEQGINVDFLAARIQGDGSTFRPWHHSDHPLNVDGDPVDAVTPADALLVVNELNQWGARMLAPPPSTVQPHAFLDVDGDNRLAPRDALLVINHLNGVAEGEGEDDAVKEGQVVDWSVPRDLQERRPIGSGSPRARASLVLSGDTAPLLPTVISPGMGRSSESESPMQDFERSETELDQMWADAFAWFRP